MTFQDLYEVSQDSFPLLYNNLKNSWKPSFQVHNFPTPFLSNTHTTSQGVDQVWNSACITHIHIWSKRCTSCPAMPCHIHTLNNTATCGNYFVRTALAAAHGTAIIILIGYVVREYNALKFVPEMLYWRQKYKETKPCWKSQRPYFKQNGALPSFLCSVRSPHLHSSALAKMRLRSSK